jgi:hypothetical protein
MAEELKGFGRAVNKQSLNVFITVIPAPDLRRQGDESSWYLFYVEPQKIYLHKLGSIMISHT